MKNLEMMLDRTMANDGASRVTELVRELIARDEISAAELLFLKYWIDDIAMLKAIVASGIDLNIVNRGGFTPLYYAASVAYSNREDKYYNVCETLLLGGAAVNQRLNIAFYAPPLKFSNYTALMAAARTNAATVVGLLLNFGADPQLKDDDGCTAREYAARHNCFLAIAALDSYSRAKPKGSCLDS